MKQIEIAKQIRNHTLTAAASVIQYKEWGDEFSVKFMRKTVNEIKESEEYASIDPSKFTKEECDELGFGLWNEQGLRVIPLWLLPYLCDEFQGACISDDDGTVRPIGLNEIDNDHRYGCIAYGVYCDD